MNLGPLESLVLTGIAVILVGGILIAIAGTPAYPLAYGAELVALFYVVLQDAGAVSTVQNFLASRIGS